MRFAVADEIKGDLRERCREANLNRLEHAGRILRLTVAEDNVDALSIACPS